MAGPASAAGGPLHATAGTPVSTPAAAPDAATQPPASLCPSPACPVSPASTSLHDSASPSAGVQVVGMSATLANAGAVAAWLGAALYEADFRPVPLAIGLAHGDVVCDRQGVPMRRLDLAPFRAACTTPVDADLVTVAALAAESVAAGHSVLVFCASRSRAACTARCLAASLAGGAPLPERAPPQGSVRFGRADAAASLAALGRPNPDLLALVPMGVAFHHAELSPEERRTVERAFAGGSVSVLAATSTLAAGVNLPVRRVVFRDMYSGRPGDRLDGTAFIQMAGRAGRAGVDDVGEVFVVQASPHDRARLLDVMAARPAPAYSCLPKPECLRRAVFEGLAARAAATSDDVMRLIGSLFAWNGGLPGGLDARRSVFDAVKRTVAWLQGGGREEEGDTSGVDADTVARRAFIRWVPAVQAGVDGVDGGGAKAAGVGGGSSDRGAGADSGPAPPARAPPAAPARAPKGYYTTLPLGKAARAVGASPDDALALRTSLDEAAAGVCLRGDLHLIYLATQPGVEALGLRLDADAARRAAASVSAALGRRDAGCLVAVAGLVGVTPGTLQALQGGRLLARARVAAVCRLWIALAVEQLVQEVREEWLRGLEGAVGGLMVVRGGRPPCVGRGAGTRSGSGSVRGGHCPCRPPLHSQPSSTLSNLPKFSSPPPPPPTPFASSLARRHGGGSGVRRDGALAAGSTGGVRPPRRPPGSLCPRPGF